MALWPNSLSRWISPDTRTVGALANAYASTNGRRLGIFTNFAKTVSVPDGYGAACATPPYLAGGMAGIARCELTATGDMLQGGPMVGSFAATSTAGPASLSLIVGMDGAFAAGSDFDGVTLAMTVGMSGSWSSTSDFAALLAMIVPFAGAFSADADFSADLKGRLSMEGSWSPYTELSPENLAASVWNSLAASFNAPGTMGELLNGAGSAGDPWIANIEGTHNAREVLRVLLAVAAGDAQVPPGVGAFTFKSQDGETDRVVGTIDESGERVVSVVDGG